MPVDSLELSDWEKILRSAIPVPDAPVTEDFKHRFNYVALQAARDIRLFSLLPAASDSDEIRGGLLHVALESSPTYETLSYVWGDPMIGPDLRLRYLSSRFDPKGTPSEQAFEAFHITTNLAGALRNLRFKIVPRLLWIDAICINQADPEERSRQVQLMASIYEQGAQSIIWLGPERYNSTLAFKIIERFASTVLKARSKPERSNEIDGDKKFRESLQESQGKDSWGDVVTIFEARDIWNRIWVLQEIVLAPNPRIYCGQQVLPWNRLGVFVETFVPPETASERALIAWKHAVTMNRLRKGFHSQLEENSRFKDDFALLSLLRSCQTFNSSDPRDMLFAVLNIASDNLGIVPNYRISPAVMWAAFIKVLMEREHVLALFHVPFFITPKGDEFWFQDLPSWVVTSRRAEEFYLHPSEDTANYRYRADKRSPKTINELPAEGVCIETLGPDADRVLAMHNFIHDHPEIDYDTASTDELLWRCVLSRFSRSPETSKGTSLRVHCPGGPDCPLQMRQRVISFESWPNTRLHHLLGLQFSVTQKGLAAFFPPSAKQGDYLYLVLRSPILLVLRPVNDHSTNLEVVGSAAVHGTNSGLLGPRILQRDFFNCHLREWKRLKVDKPKPIFLV